MADVAVLGLEQVGAGLALEDNRVLRLTGIPIPIPLATKSICHIPDPGYERNRHLALVQLDIRYTDAEVIRSSLEPVVFDIGGTWGETTIMPKHYRIVDGLVIRQRFIVRADAVSWQNDIATRVAESVEAARVAYQDENPLGPDVEVVSI